MVFTLRSFVGFMFWAWVAGLTLLLSFNALHYYTFSPFYGILPEKKEYLTNLVWTISLYIHVGAGVVCLLIPFVLFLGKTFRISVSLHRALGKIYAYDVSFLVVPSGLYLAFFAKGGTITQLGFIVQGVLVAYFTMMAVRYAKAKNREAHRIFMIRSYASVTVVLTFRLLHIVFYHLQIPYEINYALSQWVAILANLLISESIILQNQFKFNCSLNQIDR